MACPLGHKWYGCKCERCGKTRNELHNWDACKGKCKRCGEACPVRHDWNGCKCSKCGILRDEQHNWNGCGCSRCGKVRDEQHNYEASCEGWYRQCRKPRREPHRWQGIRCAKCGELKRITDKELALLTNQAEIADLAKHANGWLRIKAFDMLTNRSLAQQLLKDMIASRDEDDRVLAATKLPDSFDAQMILAECVKDDKRSDDIRSTAIGALSDQYLLGEIAKHCWEFARSATNKITNQIILADIAKNCTSEYAAVNAIDKLTDKAVLTDIANNHAKHQRSIDASNRLKQLGG